MRLNSSIRLHLSIGGDVIFIAILRVMIDSAAAAAH